MPDPVVSHRHVALGSLRLHLAEAGPGDGPPTILLHGFPEFWFGWRHQIGPLAESGLRLLIPDQRGYGLSDRPKGIAAYHLDRLARDVIALADACGVTRFRLVGHDWGGLVAFWTASFFPERVERLAVLNAFHPGVFGPYLRRHPGQVLRSAYAGAFQLPLLPERLLTARNGHLLRELMRRSSESGTFGEADLDAYAREWLRPGAVTAMLGWYRALARLPRDRHPPKVAAPTLILWGERDQALQPGLATASLALCERGRLQRFPEATHWVQHDLPEAVNAALIDFLRP
ncbi:alpha/beta fold hydrolase [Methylorubrum zatmanii]|uniref:Alpha/beta fold hydrolase n=1 Tax=Methylorubrum zatmanii TaxID=29429 RepID=A0ABW1WS96_9HYPH|nr:alpha/beta hydrolase [Methylorubrum zatmanii]MBD8905800.1 alpha/beta hydrolase [Methylorubrum zatmanii]